MTLSQTILALALGAALLTQPARAGGPEGRRGLITPFAQINGRTIRADRWATVRQRTLTLACLALTIALGLATAALIQKSALNAAATAAQAEALKGM